MTPAPTVRAPTVRAPRNATLHSRAACLSFHASHEARVFCECENKNMEIFTSVASIWYAEDSKIDFTNENIAHCNRLLLVY